MQPRKMVRDCLTIVVQDTTNVSATNLQHFENERFITLM